LGDPLLRDRKPKKFVVLQHNHPHGPRWRQRCTALRDCLGNDIGTLKFGRSGACRRPPQGARGYVGSKNAVTEFAHPEKPASEGLPFLSISLAIRALRANLLRSVLTALGIVLGVAAVVCMVAVGAGARSQISEKIRKLGTDLLFVYAGTRQALPEADAAAVLHEVPNVQISTPIIWGKVQVIAGNRHLTTMIWGNDLDYLIARQWPLTAGRVFSRDEIASGSKVAIIGDVIADKLFDGEPRSGETIRIHSIPFTIVGVLEKKGDSGSGRSQDDLVFIPLRTARSRVLGSLQEPDPEPKEELITQKKTVQVINY